jgi:hypothetical protein
MKRRARLALLPVIVATLTACPERQASPTRPLEVLAAIVADGGKAQARPSYNQVLRFDFNRLAQERFLPLFWRADANANRTLDPDELVVLWGPHGAKRADYVGPGGFTPAFDEAYRAISTKAVAPAGLAPDEARRRELVRLELSQGAPTLVETDLSARSDEDRAIAGHLLDAATSIERLFALQRGTSALEAKVSQGDPASRAMFHRNQGPWCEAPKTQQDPSCSALPGPAPRRVSGLYPAALQEDPKFCERLSREPNAAALSDHFSVVVAGDGGFVAVPYPQAWKDEMESVAVALDAAAQAVTSPDEAALKAALTASATAFRTNDWEPANAAWVAMGANNSKWYFRVAPDEVYSDPCGWKAGFALQLARINPESLEWQQRLEPVKGELERALATLAGPPYRARAVHFKLPDFIDVVLNAGDQRSPHGATIGQSLPNWGKVAERGGRTVVMTNLYTDADSQRQLKVQMASLFCAATMARATTEAAPATMSTVLHEAAHNLGPSHDYRAKGKTDDEAFGGPLASMMEELKAQTSALYFADWLAQKKLITRALAEQAHVRDVAWAFGHISRGMYDGGGNPKAYSQLASIQLGWLRQGGAFEWKAQEKAANGADVGCFELDLGAKWSRSLDALAKRVLTAKATGDRPAAEKLKADFVDDTGEWRALREEISKRWLAAPKATFVYSLGR